MSDNPDVQSTLTATLKAYDALQAAAAQTQDDAVFAQIQKNLPCYQQRIATLEGLAFAARSQAIAEAAKGVSAAQGELAHALKRINDLNQGIATVTAFLGTVDKVIAAATSVGLR